MYISIPLRGQIKALWYIYRPISLTSVCCKIMEHIIFHTCIAHLENNDIINSAQHGFRSGYSCTSQLINIVEHLAKDMDSQKQIK